MPVRSPNLHATVDHTMSIVQDSTLSKNIPTTLAENEETNENVSKEKLNNMKLMMKTFVLGALREKEQVNYTISC
jgi:RNA polymerase I-specific transcription initiation factor RRN3